MIWKLVRRDPAWKAMPYLALAAAAVSPWAAKSLDAIAPLFLFVNSMNAMAQQANRRASYFEAGLPIPARSLYVARALALLCVIMLPAFAATATILAFARAAASGTALAPVEMSAFCFLLAAVLLAVRPRQTHGPRWLFAVVYLPVYGAALWAAKAHAAGTGALVCAAVTAGLVFLTWRAIPKSFSIAPAGDLRPAPAVKRTAATGGFAWGPVLRSVFSGAFLMFLCYLPGGTLGGEWLVGGIWISFLWVTTRQKTRWLRALPVNPRLLLATIIVPMVIMLLAGYFAGFHIGKHPGAVPDERTLIVNVACVIGWALIIILINAATDWRPLRRVLFILRPAWMITAFVVLPLASIGAFFGGSGLHAVSQKIALQISGALPRDLLLATALLALVLLAIYWAANRVFEEAEFSDKPVAKRDMDALWGK